MASGSAILAVCAVLALIAGLVGYSTGGVGRGILAAVLVFIGMLFLFGLCRAAARGDEQPPNRR